MKKIILFLLLSMIVLPSVAKSNRKTTPSGKKGAALVQRVEPANWYCGMKDPSLQIMLSGAGIRDAEVSVDTKDFPEVKVDSVVRLDSPNYLFIYLNVKGASEGNLPINLQLGKKKQTLMYPLCKRAMAAEDRKGFTNADVLYMLMPDRFARGKHEADVKMNTPYSVNREEPSLRHGGDLEGIRQHLGYLKDLGVTALWFTPVLENDSPDNGKNSTYHGYATTDYYRVDPRFGTNEEYRQLISEAHQLGLKVVMDMIFNHCGFEHPWVSDMPSKDWLNTPEWLSAPKEGVATTAEGQSTTYAGGINDLYLQTSYKLTPVVDPYASKVDMRETVDGWFVPSMPDLNQRNPHLMKYLIQNSEWWIENAGIDGIRMDTYPYADARGMAHWMKVLNEEYPNFNVVGESWVTEPGFTAALQAGSGFNQNTLSADGNIEPAFKDYDLKGKNGLGGSYLNTVMDFTFFDRLNQAKNEETDAWWNGMNRIYNSFVYDFLYPNPKSVLAFLDNHDTDRFLGNSKDTLMLKQGLALLLTINRIPQIYYGTEIMMNGTKQVTDGHVREDFPGGFPGDKRDAFTEQGRTKAENAMFNWLRRLLHWRQGNKVITEGKQTQFTPWKGVYVMAHEFEGKHVLLIINGTSQPATFLWERFREVIPEGTMAREVTNDRRYNLCRDIKLTPRQTLILEY